MGEQDLFRRIAYRTASGVGSHWAFLIACAVVVVWALTGPIFHWSDTWQLVINTGTTIVTFLVVFLIQAQQNRDGRAVQLKLDELIRAQKKARNQFADIEEANEEEIERFRKEFRKLREEGVSHREAVSRAAEKLDQETD